MKKILFVLILIILIFTSACQTIQNAAPAKPATQEKKELPQWVKDLRRADIIAFGTFPFAMFTTTFIMDMNRWNNENGMDSTEYGRRYAPWPFKSTGAVEMTKDEYEQTIAVAACLSVAIAVTDLIIVKVKQHKERRRIEKLPTGSYTIQTQPYKQEPPETEEEDNTEE
jgi:hypothetical protein